MTGVEVLLHFAFSVTALDQHAQRFLGICITSNTISKECLSVARRFADNGSSRTITDTHTLGCCRPATRVAVHTHTCMLDGNRAVRIDPETNTVDLTVELPYNCQPYPVRHLVLVVEHTTCTAMPYGHAWHVFSAHQPSHDAQLINPLLAFI
jgi:hypothetical protein